VKPPAQVIPIGALDQSIGQELQKPEFAWRLPRVEEETTAPGFLDGVLQWLHKTLRAIFRFIGEILKAIIDWIFGRLPSVSPSESKGRGFPPIQKILYVLIAVLVLILAWFGWKTWKARKPRVVAESVPVAMPDLRADDVHADQLPEDEWLALVRDLMQKGEFRLALRAAYLAGLAHLGGRDLLSLARHKSNLDYWRELRRRARSQPPLLTAFEDNLLVFERAWYGRTEVTPEILAHFTGNLERIRAC
jgi:hypothetical protein